MKGKFAWAFSMLLAASCAGGTETDNPATLEDFSASACKSRETAPGQQALLLESDTEGLQCVEWSTGTDGALNVRLLNFPEPCGDKYLGAVSRGHDGSLELSVHKDSCEVFRCGLCVFDFDFAVSGVDAQHDLTLRTGSAVCATEPVAYDDAITLPLAAQPSGAVCRYLGRSAVEQYGRARGSCGQRNMPCGNCAGTDSTTCAAGLACSEVATDDSRCLAVCSTDDDCPSGLGTCQDGVCQASASYF